MQQDPAQHIADEENKAPALQSASNHQATAAAQMIDTFQSNKSQQKKNESFFPDSFDIHAFDDLIAG